MLFWRLLPTSHRILLVLGIVYFVNMALRGALTTMLALMPASTIGTGQYWRFFTYPFAIQGFWSILSSSMVLYFFAPEVERILSARKMVLLLLLFVIVHAAVYTPLLWLANIPLAGPSAVAMFVLTMYVYLYPSGEISLFGLFPLRATVLLAMMMVFSVVSALITQPVSPAAVAYIFADEGFGIFFGFIFSYLYFGNSAGLHFPWFRRKQPAQQVPSRRTTPSAASVGYSSRTSAEARSALSMSEPETEETMPLDEEQLNIILDKINEKGQSSLTAAERQFLQDYANRL